jgi:cytochrome P450
MIQENHRNYTKGENFQEIKLVIGEGLAITEGDVWRRQRRLMQPAFHRQRITALVSAMSTSIVEMLERWSTLEGGTSIDVSQEMMHLSQKMFLNALWSDSVSSETTEELLQAWDTLYLFLSNRLWALIKLPVGVPTPENRRVQQALHTLDTIAYRIIRERQQGLNERDDLLSMLLFARDESGQGMSDKELRDQIMTMFSAGFETTAVVLGWIWYSLSKHPIVERKLQAEIAAVLGGRTPTFEDLMQLKYTRMVIEEALRLYPGAWVFSRNSVADDEIGGYHIPANSMILLSPYVMHRLPAFWDNPEGFDPERFAPDNSAERPRFAYFPFGSGPRQCIGETLAMTEMQLVVAMVAQQYRLNLVPGHPVEKKPMLTLQARRGILMTLEPRAGVSGADRLDNSMQLSH